MIKFAFAKSKLKDLQRDMKGFSGVVGKIDGKNTENCFADLIQAMHSTDYCSVASHFVVHPQNSYGNVIRPLFKLTEFAKKFL